MKLINNTGSDRVIDELRQILAPKSSLDLASPAFSLFAFALSDSADRATDLRDSLDDHARLQRDIIILRSQAEKEKQLNRRVELNLEIKRLESELGVINEKLRIGSG